MIPPKVFTKEEKRLRAIIARVKLELSLGKKVANCGASQSSRSLGWLIEAEAYKLSNEAAAKVLEEM